jgi:predicted DNA-binding transcriptional regulator AlpA
LELLPRFMEVSSKEARGSFCNNALTQFEATPSNPYEDIMTLTSTAALNAFSASASAASGALMTPGQAAKYLGFTTGWLAKLRMRGGGPRHVRLGRKCRYTLADLDAWISAHRVNNTSEKSQAQREGWA